MAKLTKNRKESLTKFDVEKMYSLKEASDVIKSFSKLKFDPSIDLAVNLGVDPKKADQNVRGIVSLPNGTGKDVKVLALVTPDKEDEAKKAGADVVGSDELIEKIAAVKDRFEIESLQTAIDITDEVFLQIIPDLKEGAVEKEIAAKISYLFKMNGAEGDSYEPIIGSGYLGALPHARPSSKQFERGDFVVMDFGALYNGYHADMTRTVVIGEATSKHKEIYDIVLKSQLSGIEAAKAGITGKELDSACRSVINKAGYGDKFIHSTGHGIGLEVHTYPSVSHINEKPLLENYVVTIEPGLSLIHI